MSTLVPDMLTQVPSGELHMAHGGADKALESLENASALIADEIKRRRVFIQSLSNKC